MKLFHTKLKIMKNGLNKFAKGMFAIFTIKLFLVTMAFVIQSCNNNEIFEDNSVTEAKNSFLNSVKIGISNLDGVQLNSKNNSTFAKSTINNEEYATISVYSLPESNFTDFQTLDNVRNFNELTTIEGTELEVKYIDGSNSDNILESQELIKSYSISIESAKQSLQPTLSEAKNYLRSNGYTSADIADLLTADEDGPAMSESDLIPAVMELIAEEQNSSLAATFDYDSLFGTPMHASRIGECAGDALGISAIAVVVREGINTKAGKRLLKKAIRKVASRALGWVGAAIFVYEFGDCMDWW